MLVRRLLCFSKQLVSRPLNETQISLAKTGMELTNQSIAEVTIDLNTD